MQYADIVISTIGSHPGTVAELSFVYNRWKNKKKDNFALRHDTIMKVSDFCEDPKIIQNMLSSCSDKTPW